MRKYLAFALVFGYFAQALLADWHETHHWSSKASRAVESYEGQGCALCADAALPTLISYPIVAVAASRFSTDFLYILVSRIFDGVFARSLGARGPPLLIS